MASLIISSSAVTAVSRATSSQARQVVVPFNGTKLSNSAVTSSLVAAPFTGLKSNSTFPMSRKVDKITSLSSNGGRAKCLATDVSNFINKRLPITKATDGSWISGKDGTSITFKGTGDLKNWVEVDVSELIWGMEYTVIYLVTMENSTVDNYFKLEKTNPSGATSTSTKPYTVRQDDPIEIPFEVFKKPSTSGKIKFTFDGGKDPAQWNGLIILEARLKSLA